MLTSWRVKNFKAWRDSGAIQLAPLTVFFGENSVGKSSLGQLLLALKQTAAASTSPQLLHFGDAQSLIDLGSFAQNLHHGNLSEPLSFELQWQLPQVIHLQGVAQQSAIAVDALRLDVSIVADADQQPRLQSICYTASHQDQVQLRVTYNSEQPDALQVQVEQPQVQSYSLALADVASPTRFYQLPAVQQLDLEFMQALAAQTESVLADVHALAALRDGPKRRYTWTGAAPESVGRAGQDAAAAILAATAQQRHLQFAAGQPEQPFAQGIAYWLQQMGVASDFSVRPVADHSDEYQVLLTSHAAACEVNLADLGFGISQLLPVMVQVFYAQPNSTVWLEQPEIHLHSHVQAGLADVLIAGTQAQENGQARNVQIIVESHSEHFLNRLQRRIAEGVISHTDVALYFCSRNGTQTQIEALNVDTYGEIANWPENLFGDEMTDIAARAMAAVKRKREHAQAGTQNA
ncbi:MAG: DUF3696 domain-containing protein [Gammaproteobacteria bacterium]|nr:DUF3696 domain-containing protein [Gammaproteobacteria bacterium]